MRAFENLQSIPPQLLAEGHLGRGVHGEQLAMVASRSKPARSCPSTVNEQFGVVTEGSVSFRVGDETQTLEAGGIWRLRWIATARQETPTARRSRG